MGRIGKSVLGKRLVDQKRKFWITSPDQKIAFSEMIWLKDNVRDGYYLAYE